MWASTAPHGPTCLLSAWANQLTAWPATLPRPPLITDRQDGRIPLIAAADGGHVEVVRELLKAGANKEAASKVRSEGWWVVYLRQGRGDRWRTRIGRPLCACGIRDKACLKGGASTRVLDMQCAPNTSCVPLEGALAIYT